MTGRPDAPTAMRALWLEDGELCFRSDVPVPRPAPGEALVRVLVAGICNTDLELIRGYYPFNGVLGHEFTGKVVQGPEALIGRRVVGEINASCGSCETCRAGRRPHCPQRTVLGIVGRHGAFAEYLSLPAENLHALPEAVSTEAATFVEPLAAALQIRQQVAVRPTDRVAVVGDGKLGQLIVRSLALSGCRLTAVGRHRDKLERLRGIGVETVLADDAPERACDIAVDCTGKAAGFETALRALRPGGTLVLKSTYADKLTLDAAALVVDEITLVGSRCGPFAPAVESLRRGLVQVDDLVQARYSLEEGVEAIERARKPGTLKVLMHMGEG